MHTLHPDTHVYGLAVPSHEVGSIIKLGREALHGPLGYYQHESVGEDVRRAEQEPEQVNAELATLAVSERTTDDLEADLAAVRKRINDAHAYGWLADHRKLIELGARRDALAFELLRRQNEADHAR